MRVTETTSLGVSTVTPSDEGSVVGVVGADIAPVLFMFLTSRRTQGGDDGFGLAEALVASGLLVTLSVGLAHLTAMTSRAVQRAAADSTGLLLAVQKMEQLRSLAWTHGRVWSVAGTGVVSDVTTNLATNPSHAPPSCRPALSASEVLEAERAAMSRLMRSPSSRRPSSRESRPGRGCRDRICP